MEPYKQNLTGKMFGQLYVRNYAGKSENGKQTIWECRCYRCFRIVSVRAQSLVRGDSQTCGCSSITHGLTRGSVNGDKPTEYKSWTHAKARCHNPDNQAYADYGGRGICMCQGWKDDYASFFHDLGLKPSKRHSLERLNVNGHYSCGHCDDCIKRGWPMNCKWDTAKAQANNRRNTIWIDYNGHRKTLMQWAEELGVSYYVLHDRLFRYKISVSLAFAKRC